MTLWGRTYLLIATAVLVSVPSAFAQEPLRAEIDRLLSVESTGAIPSQTSDAEFLRRVSIDLTGMPPTADEVQAFVADTAPSKREAAVDRLLASPHFPRQMASFFDVMLMERRPNSAVSAEDWQRYLIAAFQANKPYNELAKEILSADGVDPDKRWAARFYLDRNGEPNLIARDVGRIFFGRDFQCNQCHDHPLIPDYHQTDYHGLLAFFGASANLPIKEGDKQVNYYVERAATDATFESVFIKGTRHITGPKLPGEAEITEPVFHPGDEYQVRPAENVRPVPRFSRRLQLAELATNGSNKAFNENIANRLWGYMLGRGLVSPPDLHHSSNPPTHPELLRRLSERFVEMKFDVRAFLREIALSQAYQRGIDRPADVLAAVDGAAAQLPALTTDHDARTAKVEELRKVVDAGLTEWAAAEAALLPALAERDAARAKGLEVVKKRDDAQKVVNDTTTQLNVKVTVTTSVTEASTKAQEAIKLLPQDQELASAAAKFAERVTQLNAEVETLKKTVAEKTAAVAAVDTELQATHPATDAAEAKVKPLSDVCKQKYQSYLANRILLAKDESELASLDQRIQTVKELIAAKALREQIASAEQVAAQQKAAADAAVARQSEITGTIMQADTAHQQAVLNAGTAAAALATVNAEHAKQQDGINAVNSAIASSEAALAKLPQDAALTEATQKLKSRVGELAVALAEHQKAVDASAAAEKASQDQLSAARNAFEEIIAERGRRSEAARGALQSAEQATAQVGVARGDLDKAVVELQSRWTTDASLASLKPLSPEQFCLSVFRVTGVYENYRNTEIAELDKASPLSDADKQDAAKLAAREREIEQRVYDKLLKTNYPTFVGLYGAGAGQPQGDFFASAEQALYAANGGSVLSWSAQNGNNITTQMVNEADSNKVADRLYLTVLSRLPSAEEKTDVVNYLAARPDQKAAAAQELVWGLIASVEFRFNH